MPRRAFVTVVTRNYAHFARVLMQTCRDHHPDSDLFICYADRPPETWEASTSNAQVLYGDQLKIDSWHRFSFQYTPFELSCALKPFAIAEVLDRGYDEVVYLDGDMAVYGPFTEVFAALKQHTIVITPHLLQPLPVDDHRPNESAFLVSGAYNAGFIAVRASASTSAFISWWKRMCQRQCIIDLAACLFVDQKWFDLLPGMFEGVHVLRNPGYNAGHWSLSQFSITSHPVPLIGIDGATQSVSGVCIGGSPLILFHFSGMTPNKPNEYLRSQTRTTLTQNPPLENLVKQYHEWLGKAGMSTCSAWGCAFDTLSDGTPVHPAWREAVRRDHRWLAKVGNPYDVAANHDLKGSLVSLQASAYRWRRDWQLEWGKEQGISGRVRKTGHQLKRAIKGIRQYLRAA